MTDEEISRQYYEREVRWVNFHTTYPPRIKIQGEHTETKWMDLNPISAEVLVRKLIMEFNLTIK